jgi:hypothetical protein
MPTQKQILANRRNALSSSGPKTAAGKSNARLNALKHGVRSSPHLSTSEDAGVYESLLLGLRDAFDPQDVFEEYLVSSVATSLWRRERALRAEAACLNLDVDSVDSRHEAEDAARLSDITHKLLAQASATSRMENIEDARALYSLLLTFSRGCAWLLSKLETLKSRAIAGQEDPSDIVDSLIVTSAPDDSALGRVALDYGRRRRASEKPAPSPEEIEDIIPLIDARCVQIEKLRQALY